MIKNNDKRPSSPASRCESCVFFEYDEEFDDDICTLNLDEDEYISFVSNPNYRCGYFRLDDEYSVVRKQN